MVIYNNSHSEPSPIADAEFLLFLADSVEQDGELVDALSMADETHNRESSENSAHNETIKQSQATSNKQRQTNNKQIQEVSHEE